MRGDRQPSCHQQGHPTGRFHHPQGGDEIGNAAFGDDQPVDETSQGADDQPDQDGRPDVQGANRGPHDGNLLSGKHGRHRSRDSHDRPYREIDAGPDDDQRLPHGQDDQVGVLLAHVFSVAEGGEVGSGKGKIARQEQQGDDGASP